MKSEPEQNEQDLESAPAIDQEKAQEIDPSFVPCILAFCCHHSASSAADKAGRMQIEYPSRVKLLRLPCLGRLDVIHILQAFENGADGVFVAGCPDGECRLGGGNLRARKRVEYAMRLLDEIGLGGERLAYYQMPATDGERFAEVAAQFTYFIRTLGASGTRGKSLKLQDGSKAVSQLKLTEGAKQY